MRPDQETRWGLAEGDLELGIEEGGAAGVPEQAAAQGGDLLGLVLSRSARRRGRPARGQGAVGALELPGELHGTLHEEAFDLVGRLQVVRPGLHAGLQGDGILAGQDGRPGPHAMLDGVESGAFLAGGGPGAGGLLGVAAVRFVRFDDGSAAFMAACPLRRMGIGECFRRRRMGQRVSRHRDTG